MIIDRYIATEIFRPLSAGVGLLVIVFTGYYSAVRLSEAAEGLIDPSSVAWLIFLNTAIALEVLLPTALYLSVLFAIGRLYHDSEMIAMRATGISERRIMVSTLKFTIVIAILVGIISMFVRPWAYQESYRIESEAAARVNVGIMEAGQFIGLQNGRYVLFSDRLDKDNGRMHDVFLQGDQDDESRIIVSREAWLPDPEPGQARRMEFIDGYSYTLDRSGQRDVTSRFKTLTVHLPAPAPSSSYKRKAESTRQLAQSDKPKDIAEYQWRLSTPLVTLLLGLLAVPLSRATPRQGRFASYFSAIVVYIVLLNLTNLVRNSVGSGTIPPNPGLWVAFVAPVLLLGFFLWKPRFVLAWHR